MTQIFNLIPVFINNPYSYSNAANDRLMINTNDMIHMLI